MKQFLKKTKVKLALALSAIALVTACSDGADYYSYSKVVVIGASLSDTGNVFAATGGARPGPAPFYYDGRWSNGPLWIELVAAELGVSATRSSAGGTNYAYGGAKTCTITGVTSDVPDMCVQVGMFLQANGGKADPEALYVIDAASVGNNILTFLGAGGALPSAVVTAGAPADINNLMAQLYAAGARRFLVTNAPDVGATPYVRSLGATAATTSTALSNAYNAALSSTLNNFRASYSGSVVNLVDLADLGKKVVANPAAYGYTNTTEPCVSSTGTICANPGSYQYWDPFHPTATTGKTFANVALAALL
jgi:outer membrane lipase/esterase